MTKTTVLLLVGLPGSGKSTLARHLCEYRKPSSHIEYDAISRSMDSRNSLDAWNQSRSIALEYLSTELRSTYSSLVVMDDNYHFKSMRKEVYRFCQNHVSEGCIIYFGVVYVNTPLEICMKRNNLREAQLCVSDKVILRMKMSIEPPNESKAPWDFNNLQFIYNDDARFIKLYDFIDDLEKGIPLQQILELERGEICQPKLHVYDQNLRKWVGFVSRIDKHKCTAANMSRKNILDKLRAGNFTSLVHFIDFFCEEVCDGWNDEQVQALRINLMSTVYLTFELYRYNIMIFMPGNNIIIL
jgi:tRNA uridine 5-carbamoylmethylation protein Kti12